ncbi:putative histone-lysine N-methyltransferase chromatin remodeling SET family [Lupinus albus]|uniref:Putative histone-lysine N-methyltransferase chromatin remodeling SET family n=1 Tax=Lupinus albus TaxID=3870 RepID=A0A6A4R121_LUPAL|nr:putative histone-lysine N-methyltransferase chromatin remodeling SET family [Lupinus albus]
MAPDPRVAKAFNASRALGIPDEEMKPVLKYLLKVYGGKWELIEEDNYRTLVDAYFELKEDKETEGKRKAPSSDNDRERPRQKLNSVDGDEQVLSSGKSRQVSIKKDTEIQGNSEYPIDGPCVSHIQREKMASDHHQKKLMTPKIDKPLILMPNDGVQNELKTPRVEKPKSLHGPGSASHRVSLGPPKESSIGNVRVKSLTTLYQYHEKDDTLDDQDTSRISPKFLSDITKGSENVKISLLDETGREELPKFNYTPCNIIYQCANVNISLARIADQGCCSDCSGDCLSLPFPCACAQETGGEFAYTQQGLLKEEFLEDCISMKNEPKDHHFLYCQECPLERSKNEIKPEPCKGHMVKKFIKECWRKCGCDMQCGNRVVQRGLTCKLQVFLTGEGKGWGVRALEELPKGSYVCEYAGEILTNTELYERTVRIGGNEKHTYPVTLDADWGSEGVLKDEEALCLDATFNGNVARFINHRCSDANLLDVPVEVETPDRHYYHLALFTNRKVKALEELTWDYGIDFDDHEHPIKAFHCFCGSAFCRDKKQKGTR